MGQGVSRATSSDLLFLVRANGARRCALQVDGDTRLATVDWRRCFSRVVLYLLSDVSWEHLSISGRSHSNRERPNSRQHRSIQIRATSNVRRIHPLHLRHRAPAWFHLRTARSAVAEHIDHLASGAWRASLKERTAGLRRLHDSSETPLRALCFLRGRRGALAEFQCPRTNAWTNSTCFTVAACFLRRTPELSKWSALLDKLAIEARELSDENVRERKDSGAQWN